MLKQLTGALVLGLSVLALGSVQAQDAGNAKINAVRVVYSEVNALKDAGKLSMVKKDVPGCSGATESHQLWSDAAGNVRRYQTKDGVYTFEYTYDNKGVLRYLGGLGNNNQGQKITWRYYFNEKGGQVWYDYQFQGGRSSWIDAKTRLVKNPKDAFEKTPAC
jgi:hypothetical protein